MRAALCNWRRAICCKICQGGRQVRIDVGTAARDLEVQFIRSPGSLSCTNVLFWWNQAIGGAGGDGAGTGPVLAATDRAGRSSPRAECRGCRNGNSPRIRPPAGAPDMTAVPVSGGRAMGLVPCRIRARTSGWISSLCSQIKRRRDFSLQYSQTNACGALLWSSRRELCGGEERIFYDNHAYRWRGPHSCPRAAATFEAAQRGGLSILSGTAGLTNSTLAPILPRGELAFSGSQGEVRGTASGGGLSCQGQLTLSTRRFVRTSARAGDALVILFLWRTSKRRSYFSPAGTSMLDHATIRRQQARWGIALAFGAPVSTGVIAGAGIWISNAMLTLRDSLLGFGSSRSNCFGTLIDGGYNISSDGSCKLRGARQPEQHGLQARTA